MSFVFSSRCVFQAASFSRFAALPPLACLSLIRSARARRVPYVHGSASARPSQRRGRRPRSCFGYAPLESSLFFPLCDLSSFDYQSFIALFVGPPLTSLLTPPQGIKKLWNQPINVRALVEIPPQSKAPRVILRVLLGAVVAGLAWGAWRFLH